MASQLGESLMDQVRGGCENSASCLAYERSSRAHVGVRLGQETNVRCMCCCETTEQRALVNGV